MTAGSVAPEDEACLEDEKRDCLARWLLANPEAGRRMWKNWRNHLHKAAKSRAWLDDMRERIRRLRRECSN